MSSLASGLLIKRIMNNRITNTIKKYNMVSAGDKVLVACSGGADSMILLNYFISVKESMQLSLCVAHIEHGIRGKDSVDDAEFVKAFCENNKIEFHLLSIDAEKESKKLGIGVEEYSRKRRYEFFDTIECDKIATAHNASDNTETVLFRMFRGTGIKGLCGIPAVRGKIIRPLIEIPSDDIRSYCKSNSIEYRVDCTNHRNDYTRNYIRNVIVPEIKSINPNTDLAFSNMIADLTEDKNFIYSYATKVYNEAFCNNMLDIDVLNKYDLSIIKRVICAYFNNFGVDIDRVHLNSVLQLLDKSARVQLCGDIYAVSAGGYLRYADFSQNDSEFNFVTEILKISELDKKSVDFYCDYDKIIGKVKIKSRQAGDTISPAGRHCSKSLKKLFNELKIPQERRDSVAVVSDDCSVIGVVGYCVDERVKVDVDTKKVLTLKLPTEDF